MLPNVLLVDNDKHILEVMSVYLEDVATVSTVLGGHQALEFVQQHPVDVIFLDVDMPIMDGFATLEQLRNIEKCINVPIVLVTGKTDKHTILNSFVMGVDGYLAKPVSKDNLVNKLQEVYQAKTTKHDKKTVLMIDDDMSYLKQLNNMLCDSYNIIMINSAKLALNYLMKNTPDVILLDYQMPLYNGANIMNMIQNGIMLDLFLLNGMILVKIITQSSLKYLNRTTKCLNGLPSIYFIEMSCGNLNMISPSICIRHNSQ